MCFGNCQIIIKISYDSNHQLASVILIYHHLVAVGTCAKGVDNSRPTDHTRKIWNMIRDEQYSSVCIRISGGIKKGKLAQ